MTKREALLKLRDAVRDGTASGEFTLWNDALGDLIYIDGLNAYNGSTDAAIALVEAVLPGWAWNINSNGEAYVAEGLGPPKEAESANPSRALLLATLEALIAKEEAQMSDDLVKRLRRIAHIPGTVICAEAADEIERLRAEIEELDFLRHEGGENSVAALETENVRLRTEIHRLKAEAAEHAALARK